jgi:hypothetical protein
MVCYIYVRLRNKGFVLFTVVYMSVCILLELYFTNFCDIYFYTIHIIYGRPCMTFSVLFNVDAYFLCTCPLDINVC